MTKKEIIKKARIIARRIGKVYDPEQVILFGSYAWGKPTRDSDLDFFITTKKSPNFLRDQQKIRKVIAGEMPIDLLLYSKSQIRRRIGMGDSFVQRIIDRGISLYEKKSRQKK